MLPCLAPKSLLVLPKGSKVNKDGSAGSLVAFERYSTNGDDNTGTVVVYSGERGRQILDPESGELASSFVVPCGSCINCRRNRSFRWSRRLLMESDGYKSDEMCFLTLTYDDDHLPPDGELHYDDVQAFLKRLRKNCPSNLRYFLAGEYGDLFDRCHWHVILFGHDFFVGARIAGYGEDQAPLFSNKLIDDAWKKGFAEFGMVTPASIQYVAGYVTKKLKDDQCRHKVKPFVRMSLKPGIGHNFLLKNAEIIERDGGFYLRGKFYQLDAASLRFLLREERVDDKFAFDLQEKKKAVAKLYENLYKKFTDKDKIKLDKELALWYNVRNRLGDIYGSKATK